MEVKTMTIEEFEAISRGPYGPSSELGKILAAMQPGECVILPHVNYKCRQKTELKERSCSLQSTVSLASRRNKTTKLLTRHLPDGQVAIACYAKEC